jgi:dipeptidyl aminopeptidase/acylaminoacyl peptidase
MKHLLTLVLTAGFFLGQSQSSMGDFMSYPFPSSLVSAKSANRMAWVFNEQGQRNVYVAEAPGFTPRKISSFDLDDGQEISSLSLSNDGEWVVFVRGGEHGSNWDDEVTINPLSLPIPPKVEMFAISFDGLQEINLGAGAAPVFSPENAVIFQKDRQLWSRQLHKDSSAVKLTELRGTIASPRFSPDGSKMAFVSYRGDHSYIGIYTDAETRIKWIAPGYDRDYLPRWSPDGSKIVFVRRPGAGGAPNPALQLSPSPWSLMVYDLKEDKTSTIWTAPETLEGSIPRTHGGINLHWASTNNIVFNSYMDGWPHLYKINPAGGKAELLTPGDFMCEYISISPDGERAYFAGNTGPDQYDIERRHIVKVAIEKANLEVLTPGNGNEWAPQELADGTVVFLSGGPQRPPLPAYLDKRKIKLLASDKIENYPSSELVVPKQVLFESSDGLEIHGTWFEKEGGPAQKPAIIYIHGGPPRQMLLGWHYSSYYSNAYATNQYLANQGFIVVSVNYRLGIGYGFDFHNPEKANWRGASEYQDIEAAGKWLAAHPGVDPERIGVYGGSYGGYLTAFALARNSDIFKAGVDIHGVHDRTVNRLRNFTNPDGYEKAPDIEAIPETMWKSSPIAYIDGWTSPVLIIHGDDDRNVPFSQSVDLVQRLREKEVDIETMVIVDESHHFMVHENQQRVNEAIVEYLVRKVKKE